jgi:hypothetical protein
MVKKAAIERGEKKEGYYIKWSSGKTIKIKI